MKITEAQILDNQEFTVPDFLQIYYPFKVCMWNSRFEHQAEENL
jgi:hypothetical protein